MADIAAIASILGSVKTATEIAKLLKDSDLSLEKAEMKLKLADLISALADARIETAEIQSLIAEKDEKIKQLQEVLETKNSSFGVQICTEAARNYLINKGSRPHGRL